MQVGFPDNSELIISGHMHAALEGCRGKACLGTLLGYIKLFSLLQSECWDLPAAVLAQTQTPSHTTTLQAPAVLDGAEWAPWRNGREWGTPALWASVEMSTF